MTLVKTPWSDFFSSINVRVVANNAPEIVTMHPSQKDDYMNAGRLLDLKPILDKNFPNFDLADYSDAALSEYSRPVGCSWSKTAKVPCVNLYGLPYHSNYTMMAYNPAIFKKAGLPSPKEMLTSGTWTWDHLGSVMKDLVTKGGAKYAWDESSFSMLSDASWLVMPIIYAPFGGGPWTADQKSCAFTSPESVTATQAVWDMVFKDKTFPPPGAAVSGSSFANGDLAMQEVFLGSSIVKPTFPYDIVPLPGGPAGAKPFAETKALTVFKDAPNAAAAADFAIWLTTKENALAEVQLWQVPRKSLTSSEAFTSGALASGGGAVTPEAWRDVVVPMTKQNAWPRSYAIANFGQIFAASQPIFNKIWTANADIKGLLTQVCEVIQPRLPK
jgi:multiple sugar transport system substrate-binding protein